jgi:hypothetical protein
MVVRIHIRDETCKAMADAPARPLLADLLMIWERERTYSFLSWAEGVASVICYLYR